jgi:NitT/TauT family transport system permease protein
MAVAFGYSELANGIIVVIIAFFPITTNFLLGLRSVDRGLDDLFALSGASWTTRFRKLAFPHSLPQLLTGFRISAGLAVIGSIVGEEFFQYGSPGLGMRILQYIDTVEYNRLYGCIILSSLLGISFYLLFNWLSRRLLRSWHESAQADRR